MEFGQMDNVEIEGCRQTALFELRKIDVTILAKASEDKSSFAKASEDKAEREGFEPSVQLPVQRFSRPSRSATLAPLPKKAVLSPESRN